MNLTTSLPGPDATVSHHGSICLVHPQTKAARTWIDESVALEAQFLGNALVVEPRYLDDLLAGMRSAGLEVS